MVSLQCPIQSLTQFNCERNHPLSTDKDLKIQREHYIHFEDVGNEITLKCSTKGPKKATINESPQRYIVMQQNGLRILITIFMLIDTVTPVNTTNLLI